jgi:hypothetical protein
VLEGRSYLNGIKVHVLKVAGFAARGGGRLDEKSAASEIWILQQLSASDYNVDVMPSLKWRFLVFVLALASGVTFLSAVVVTGRQYHGKEVRCIHGGSWYQVLALGVYSRARGYERVFTGTVQSATDISDTDKRLEITPDEVLRGDAVGEVTATVNEACIPEDLPDIKAGDKWLFYLSHNMMLGEPSKPVSQAEYDICLLRLHSDLDESCIAVMPTQRHRKLPYPIPYCTSSLESLLFRQLAKTTTFQDGIHLTHIITPRGLLHDSKRLNASEAFFQLAPWPPSCVLDAEVSGRK